MEKQVMDYMLVPAGLLMMLAYHIWLLHRIIHRPTTTIIGINAINRRFWVSAMMQEVEKNGVLAVQTLRNNIMASTLLASTAIMLCSLIAFLMMGSCGANGGGNHGTENLVIMGMGDSSHIGLSVKMFSILICFLAAFLLNVQSIRFYSHASVLINVPFRNFYHHHHHLHCDGRGEHGEHISGGDGNGDVEGSGCSLVSSGYDGYVARTVNKGSYFWSLGLRAFYFSFPLFLWVFGPIPMFLCCFSLVFFLYFLDVASHSAWALDGLSQQHRRRPGHQNPKNNKPTICQAMYEI